MRIGLKTQVKLQLEQLQKERHIYQGKFEVFSAKQIDLIQEMVDNGVNWVLQNNKLTHFINLDAISQKFRDENKLLIHDHDQM